MRKASIANPKKTPIAACSIVSPTRRAVSPPGAVCAKASAIAPSQTGAIATIQPPKDAVMCATKRLAGKKTIIRPMCTAFVRANMAASSPTSSTRPAASIRRRTCSPRPNENAILSTSHKNKIACAISTNAESVSHERLNCTKIEDCTRAHNCVETDAQCVCALVHQHQGHRGEKKR
jgi:hypothetical protein